MNPGTEKRPSKTVLILLLLIVLVGCVLRFYGLGRESLWNDELAHWYWANRPRLAMVIHDCAVEDVHPPGGHIALYFLEKYVGDSETVLRLPAAICGVLAVLAVFLVGSRLYSYREGLIAAAFTAVLWCPVYYSQEARTYSPLLLFTLLSMYWWLAIARALREGARPSYGARVGYSFAAIISCYLHYFGLYFVALQGLGLALLVIRKRRALVAVAIVYLPIVLAYVLWLPALWRHLNLGPVYIKRPKPYAFVSLLLFLFNASVYVVLAIIGGLFAVLLHRVHTAGKRRALACFRGRPGFPELVLLAWLIVPFVGAFLKSLVSVPVLTCRNLIISLPAAYLLLARLITRLCDRPRHRIVVTSLLVAMFLFHLIFVKGYYSRPRKEQFREAVAYIAEHDSLYEESIVLGYSWNPAYFNYYFERLGSAKRVRVNAGQKEHAGSVTEAIEQHHPRYIWYVRGHRVPEPEFLAFLTERLTLKLHKAFVGTDVWLFETE